MHEETLPAFQLGATQVTQANYERVMKVNLSSFKGADLPVTNLGPFEIRTFCNRLSQMAGLAPCYAEAPNAGHQGRASILSASKPNGPAMPQQLELISSHRAGFFQQRDLVHRPPENSFVVAVAVQDYLRTLKSVRHPLGSLCGQPVGKQPHLLAHALSARGKRPGWEKLQSLILENAGAAWLEGAKMNDIELDSGAMRSSTLAR